MRGIELTSVHRSASVCGSKLEQQHLMPIIKATSVDLASHCIDPAGTDTCRAKVIAHDDLLVLRFDWGIESTPATLQSAVLDGKKRVLRMTKEGEEVPCRGRRILAMSRECPT